jgi:hypothetical protein
MRQLCTGGILVTTLGFSAFGQEKAPAPTSSNGPALAAPSTPAAPSAGLLNDWLRGESTAFQPWDLGGQFRARFESKQYFAVPNEGAVDFQRTGDPDNNYFLLRGRLHLGYTPWSWLSVFGEMQTSSSFEDDRSPSPDQDLYMLRQAWVKVGDAKEFPLTLKAGRQELIYGDQRLVGTADWLNIGRTFDAAKLRYESQHFWVDAFVSQPVIPDRYEFDESDNHDIFSAIYASTRSLVPVQETQLYFLARNVSQHSPSEVIDKLYPVASPRDIYTIGARVKSLPGSLKGWDYEAELAGQFGSFQFNNTSPSLDQQAFAGHVAGGYTWTSVSTAPRVGLEYNYASGDSNPNDGKHGTFDNLFPSNHGLYGAMDFFSLQNVQDVHLTGSIKPVKKLAVKLDGYCFWLANTQDYFYQANGNPRRTGGYGINPNAGNYVGSELDVIATYNITPFTYVQAGYGHFFVGDYVKNTLATHGGATDANFVFAQLYFNF